MRHHKSEAKLSFEADNLAVPEVHTGPVEDTELEPFDGEIQYEDVAIPEVHISAMERRAQADS